LVEQTANETNIRAIAKPQQINIARGLRLLKPGERWQLNAADGSKILPASLPAVSSTTLEIETRRSVTKQRYNVAALAYSRFESTVSYLLTFEAVTEEMSLMSSIK